MFQVPCDVKVTFSFTNPVVGLCKIPLWGYFVGMKCSHTGDPSYHLNRGIRYLERSFHHSSTQGGYHPERGLSPVTTLGDYHPLEKTITSPLVDFGLLHQYEEKGEWPADHIWSTSSLTPFPHHHYFLVICFQPKGYGLGVLTTTYCHFRLGVPLGWTAQTHACKTSTSVVYEIKINQWINLVTYAFDIF